MESRERTVVPRNVRAVGGSVALDRVGRAESHRQRALAVDSAAERLVESYKAARSAAAALLDPRPRRRGPGDVWHRLEVEVPELKEWSRAFAGYTRLCAAIEDGLPRMVEPEMADDFLWAVERFLDVVDSKLGVLGPAA